MFGFIAVNKPSGISSRKAIDSVKKLARPNKVGHTGTLDPLAAGVLVVAIGPATRLARFVQSMPKLYTADFQFGVTSDSDDNETELRVIDGAEPFSELQLGVAVENFKGDIQQTPPAYSAVKIEGKRAYELARQGTSFEIDSKIVTIHSIDIISFAYPNCRLKVKCGSGTYIRSLGRDLGVELKSGAVMTGLVRDAVGPFTIADAVEIEDLNEESVHERLVSPLTLFENEATVSMNEKQISSLAVGGLFSAPELGLADDVGTFVAVDQAKRLLAVFERHSSGKFKPAINFVHYYDQFQSS